MIETEKLSSKVSVRRTPLSFSIVVGPQRSLWTMILTPLAFFYTEFRLVIALKRLPYLRTFVGLGVVLGLFYVWWFCWNVFGRQELIIREGDMTITKKIFGMGPARTVRIGEITAIRYREDGYRVPNFVVFVVSGRRTGYPFGETLERADLMVVLDAIAKGIPMLAGKIHRSDFE